MDIVPASYFSFKELTEAYNQTRVDYLVPMPMNVERLREYARVYDVDLNSSCVAVDDDTIWGLGMLGVRGDRCWITRLGVLPAGRRQGTGTALLEWMLDRAEEHRCRTAWLEVIKGNTPGHNLFDKFAFEERQELIVGRRPPNTTVRPLPSTIKHVTYLEHEDAIYLLEQRKQRPNWLNETESMKNVRNLPALAPGSKSGITQTSRNISAILVQLADGSEGWVSYQATFLQLTRIVVEVVVGDPVEVTEAVLRTLHQHHIRQDAIVENIVDDVQWLGFQRAGYFEAFRRIEMVKTIRPAHA